MHLTFLCADTSIIGKVDPSMLTDQQMLELFFTPSDEREARSELKGDADDGCTWAGVTCENEEHIKRIRWCSWEVRLVGSIDLRRVPPHTESILLYKEALSGTMDVTGLPSSLIQISLQECAFSGTLDLGHLPQGIRSFGVHANCITAVQNVCNLPLSLEHLIVEELQIEAKSIYVGALPANDLRPNFAACGFTDLQCEREEDRARIDTNLNEFLSRIE